MDPLKIDQKLLESISSRLLGKGFSLSLEDVTAVADLIKDEIVYLYVNKLITQLRKILGIDPSLTEREILQFVAKTIVEYLGAEIASIGIYDPERKGMISRVILKAGSKKHPSHARLHLPVQAFHGSVGNDYEVKASIVSN